MLLESQAELKKFAAHLQNIREEERVLLAREIHDQLGQILVAVKIDMGMLKMNVLRKFGKEVTDELLHKFDGLSALIDTTIKTARRIMSDLRPEVLDMLGFIDAVNQHLNSFKERYKVASSFINNSVGLELTSEQSVALFRIVQESLNNIAKHAKATEVVITVNHTSDKMFLLIADNGVGFDTTDKKNQDSYGLIGMKERVFLIDGSLTIISEKGKGTTIQIIIPIV
jgi:signal transduction histidine kinase